MNTWKKRYLTILAGQGISLLTSGILQMAIIFYLTAKTNSAMVLSAATFVGFIPQAILGPFAGAFVDRHSRKKSDDWCRPFDRSRRRAVGGGCCIYRSAHLDYHAGSLYPQHRKCLSHSSFQCGDTTDGSTGATYKMRWIYSDYVGSRVPYQSGRCCCSLQRLAPQLYHYVGYCGSGFGLWHRCTSAYPQSPGAEE